MTAAKAFMQVDAFTETPLEGNACAVVFDADELTPDLMLRIAREMNLSETSFVMRSSVADFRARYFTPMEEIPLAGHPTIATVFAMYDSGRLPVTADYMQISLELQVGPIPIEVYAEQGKVKRVVMSQKKPQFLRTYSASEIAPIFGISPSDLLPDVPIQTVSTGTPQLMVAAKSLEVLRRSALNLPLYIQLRQAGDFFSSHIFCLEGATPAGDTFARHFVIPPDLIEDPFTGSATGGMGAFLWKYGLIDKQTFRAEQGHLMHRPGIATVEVVGPRDDISTVKVGGSAVTVLTGELRLPSS